MKSNFLNIKKTFLLMASIALIGFGCSSDSKNSETTASTAAPKVEATPEYGVGPVKNVQVSAEVDQALAETGKAIFEAKCTACHQFEDRYVGPALGDVTERRNHAWIMNMILNPEEMTKKDPEARKLLAEYMTQMVNQNVSEDDARAILEYLRSVNEQQVN